jgi:hypothetical protein
MRDDVKNDEQCGCPMKLVTDKKWGDKSNLNGDIIISVTFRNKVTIPVNCI